MNKELEVCDFRYDEGFRTRVEKGIMPTITTKGMKALSGSPMVIERERVLMENNEINYRIRKLTSKECWRLMGFTDEDFEKAKQVNSDSQLYKQAGNSIVVDVLEAIFREML